MIFKAVISTQTEEEAYADAEYRKFLKEKSQYKDFDEFCREQGLNDC